MGESRDGEASCEEEKRGRRDGIDEEKAVGDQDGKCARLKIGEAGGEHHFVVSRRRSASCPVNKAVGAPLAVVVGCVHVTTRLRAYPNLPPYVSATIIAGPVQHQQ